MWSMWLSVAVVTLSLVAAQRACDLTHDCPAPYDHDSFASTHTSEPHFTATYPSPRAATYDSDEREGAVESTFFPGMMVPPEVEEALGTLLSKETVQWLDKQEAEGKEAVNLEGQIIPDDMKDVIRNFVQRNDPEYKPNKRTPTMETVQVRNGGTKPGSPFVDKRGPLALDCPPRRPSVSSFQFSDKWTKPMMKMLLKRDVLMMGLGTVLLVATVAAVLYVYGVPDIWAAVSHGLSIIRQRFSSTAVHHEVHSEVQTSPKPHVKSNGRSKSKEATSKSSSKKRSKSASTRSRSEATEVKKEVTQWKSTKGKVVGDPSEEDENNDWQEVMHNKPKCRSKSKQLQEEDSYPLASKSPSRPTTPKTPPRSTTSSEQTTKSEETTVSQVKPIKTHHASMKRESWTTGDEVNMGLQLTMTSSGAFSDEKTPSSGFDLSTLSNETHFLQTPVQQSPFAASTDIPFFTSSPIRGGYPSVHSPTEQQFQSKVDCLLRNLRNKPFSMHPVSSTTHLRRTATDLEERMFVHRMGMSMQPSFSGSLDPMLSASGTLNNRLIYSDDGYMTRQFSGGLPPAHSTRMRQRAGSLPLAQSQSPSLYSPGQSGLNSVQAHGLSSNCSLFSSNPSIWSVDLAVDRDLVKSSMTNSSSSLRQTPPTESLDFKRCLPDQLLSEMSSPDSYP